MLLQHMVIRDRRHLSEDGFVLPIITMNKNSGLAEGPRRSLAAASCRWMKEPTFFAMPAKWS